MIIKKLKIQNIRSYNDQEIIFPKGSTLLSGDIGSGKTTILLAIEFALFGLQPSQKGGSLLKNDRDEAKVILEFEIGDKNVIIERMLKKKKKSITQDYASIIINNEGFDESITEIKTKILKLLNYPQEFSKKTNLLYKFTVYTPQEEMKQIIMESGDVRLNTLRYVFGIDKYKRIQENVLLLASKLREKAKINLALISDLEYMKESSKSKKESLILLSKAKKERENEYNNTIKQKKDKEKELETIVDKIEEKKSIENRLSNRDTLITEKKQQLVSIINSIRRLNKDIQEAKKISFNPEEFNSLNLRIEFQENKNKELEKEYIEIISRIKSNESKITEALSLKNKIKDIEKCPTCLQNVSNEYKNNIFENSNKEIEMTENYMMQLSDKKYFLEKQIDETKDNINDYKNKKSVLELLKIKAEAIKEKEQSINEIDLQKQTLEKEIDNLQIDILKIKESIKEYQKYDLIFKEKNSELLIIKNKENENLIKLTELKKEMQFLERDIKELNNEIKEKELIKKETEKIKKLESWLSQKFLEIVLFAEKQIMITLKDEFSRLFSKWFSILVSDSLTAKLDDDFSPIIEQQDYELDYLFLSGGERTAIALAYRLSLNQVINSVLSNINTSNLVILDEPTDGFSNQQLDKMRDVLDQLKIEQLILVSHEPKMESFVDNIIKIRKYNGISEIDNH